MAYGHPAQSAAHRPLITAHSLRPTAHKAATLMRRLKVVRAVIACGYNVLYSDADVVWLRDFVPFMFPVKLDFMYMPNWPTWSGM